ncbi:MAG: DUF4440 domain-containing protein, partial [Nitrosospira sp.]
NLGDVYEKMASQAYGKALQLDKGNAAAQTKLAMIKDLFSGRTQGIQTGSAKSPSDLSSKSPEKVTEKEPQKTAEKTLSDKFSTAEKPVPEKSLTSDRDSNEVLKTVNAWAKAWSGKDVATYLGFYASDFHTPRGTSRSAWEKSRHERLSKPKSIHVEITHPKVSFSDVRHAKVSFRQSYHSDAIRTATTKTLEMVKTGEKWLIKQEQVGR